MSVVDDQIKKVRVAIATYDRDRAVLDKAIQREAYPDLLYIFRDSVAESTTAVVNETEALLTILDQQRITALADEQPEA